MHTPALPMAANWGGAGYRRAFESVMQASRAQCFEE